MSIYAGHSIWANPLPAVSVMFERIQEKLANNIRGLIGFILGFLLLDHTLQFFLVPILHGFFWLLFEELFPLIRVNINVFWFNLYFHVVRVLAFFTLLAKSLFEIRTQNRLWVNICLFLDGGKLNQTVQQSLFFIKFLLSLFFFELFWDLFIRQTPLWNLIS